MQKCERSMENQLSTGPLSLTIGMHKPLQVPLSSYVDPLFFSVNTADCLGVLSLHILTVLSFALLLPSAFSHIDTKGMPTVWTSRAILLSRYVVQVVFWF